MLRMLRLVALAALVAAGASFPAQAQRLTSGAWESDFIIGSQGTPMCTLGTKMATGDVLWIKVSTAQPDAMIQIVARRQRVLHEAFNANLKVDNLDHWRITFRRMADFPNVGQAWAPREVTIRFLTEMARGYQFAIAYEGGTYDNGSLYGSQAAIYHFANCVGNLGGYAPAPQPAPRVPTPPRYTDV